MTAAGWPYRIVMFAVLRDRALKLSTPALVATAFGGVAAVSAVEIGVIEPAVKAWVRSAKPEGERKLLERLDREALEAGERAMAQQPSAAGIPSAWRFSLAAWAKGGDGNR